MTDSEHVCIVGVSYGGYAALAGAAFTPDLYRCALSIAGISDLGRLLKEDKSRYGRDHEVLPYLERSILDSEADAQALRNVSPIYAAEAVKVPVLLIHGEDDTVVDFEQSRRMYRALKRADKQVRLVKLKHEDHFLREGSTRLQTLSEIIGFIDQHLGEQGKDTD